MLQGGFVGYLLLIGKVVFSLDYVFSFVNINRRRRLHFFYKAMKGPFLVGRFSISAVVASTS